MIETYLADDHRLFCDGLEKLLTETGNFKISQKFYNGRSLLENMSSSSPTLLIMDIEMPGMNGLDLIKRVHFINPNVKIVILSLHDEKAFVQEAFLQGASAYFDKSVECEILIDALLKVCRGEKIFKELIVFENGKPLLSEREREILKLIARGKTSETIATQLKISHLTVKAHRRNMLKKLDSKNTSELIIKAIEKELL